MSGNSVSVNDDVNFYIDKIHRFKEELTKPFVGREEEARVIILALMTGEHAVLIGEPGTAKSALIRRAAQLLNARLFMYLLTKFTEPSELFGPLDLTALKEGVYTRITKGKMLEADIVFLDEIFKANSAILNSILTILNERIFYDGYTEIRVPLWSLFGASNEVPDDPELEALYDRMLLRHHVKPLAEDYWRDLIDYEWRFEKKLLYEEKIEPIMSMSDLRNIRYIVMEKINFESIKSKLLKIYSILEGKGIHVTDRRKGKALKIVAASALLEGRRETVESDLLVLKYIAPRDIEDFEKVNTILNEELRTPYRYLKMLEEIKVNVRDISSYVASYPRPPLSRFLEQKLIEIYRDLELTRERVVSIIIESGDKNVEREGRDIIAMIDAVLESIKKRLG
ncbi:MAG: AAA family ATPase [Sulfolobales archaeon]